jgi:protein-disulfide isomerase
MQEKKSSSVGIVIAILVTSLLIAGGIVAAALIISANNNSGSEPTKTSKVDEPKKSEKDNPGILSTDHVRGKRDSKVLVIEYADPQCPGCATMMPKMDALYEDYKDEVAFVYRHYPISGHINAESAAIAIEAAGKQGYFWEMLSAMFENRSDWVYESGDDLTDAYVDIFKDVAGKKGDISKFKKDLDDDKLKDKVKSDKNLGIDDEISATPTVFVNGEQVDFYTSSNPKKTIEEAIKEALED